jgi:hypothetical protein
MMMLCLELLSIALLLGSACGVGEEKTPIYFSYITTESFAISALPVVDLALEQINSRTDVLPNYTLNYTTIQQSTVSPLATHVGDRACLSPSLCACSAVVEVLLMRLWNTSDWTWKNQPTCPSSAADAPFPTF